MASSVAESAPLVKNFYEESGGRKGILAWLLSTDHKRIGIMYLMSML